MNEYRPVWCEGEYAYMRNDAGILWRRLLKPDFKYTPWEIVNETTVDQEEDSVDQE